VTFATRDKVDIITRPPEKRGFTKLDIDLPTGHVRQLDGVRGLAITLVLVFHCFAFRPWVRVTSFGWTGVDLFFVLSGFLITGILLDSKSRPHCYRNFIVRRALRIFPLYYFALAAFFFFNLILHFGADDAGKLLPYLATYTQNIYFAFHGWLKDTGSAINHFWSLAQEEQFYLFWPLLVLSLKKKWLMRLCLLGISVSLAVRFIHPDYPFCYVFPLARMDSMFTGALAAVLIRSDRPLLNRVVLPLLILSGSAVAIGGITGHHLNFHAPFFRHAGYTLIDVFFGCVILLSLDRGTLFGGLLKSFFEQRWLVFLGKYSYGIYVYHWILFRAVFPQCFEHLKSYGVNLSVASALFVLLVIALSVCSYQLLEKRFLDLKERLTG
jgi:peptidoglycan/LPS O-acetylase OafA/YrhL